jgi:hypothetical protein
MPARFSGFEPDTASQVSASGCRRISRSMPMASGSANCSPENPATIEGYFPVVSTFCFSSSFIFLTVGFWSLSPVV